MEIVGSVAPEQVPASVSTVKGLWTNLARRAIADYEKGRVTYVTVQDEAEHRRMRNGMLAYVRRHGYRLSSVATRDSPTQPLKVYLQLHPREEEEKPDAKPVRKVRRAGTR